MSQGQHELLRHPLFSHIWCKQKLLLFETSPSKSWTHCVCRTRCCHFRYNTTPFVRIPHKAVMPLRNVGTSQTIILSQLTFGASKRGVKVSNSGERCSQDSKKHKTLLIDIFQLSVQLQPSSHRFFPAPLTELQVREPHHRPLRHPPFQSLRRHCVPDCLRW